MRYSYEFKRKCVELYYRGEYPDTPDGIDSRRFHKLVREWVRIEESCGAPACCSSALSLLQKSPLPMYLHY